MSASAAASTRQSSHSKRWGEVFCASSACCIRQYVAASSVLPQRQHRAVASSWPPSLSARRIAARGMGILSSPCTTSARTAASSAGATSGVKRSSFSTATETIVSPPGMIDRSFGKHTLIARGISRLVSSRAYEGLSAGCLWSDCTLGRARRCSRAVTTDAHVDGARREVGDGVVGRPLDEALVGGVGEPHAHTRLRVAEHQRQRADRSHGS
mmetsp:Transcript_20084/g.80125  ORF Transcript_20084/g.80125 Transcript_20084/m.80125 type:complete len:212 (+) Transcript_20084:212-847(+)